EIEAVMPSYFAAWDDDETHVAKQRAGDWAQVADGLYKYLHRHHSKFREQRESELSGREQVILYSEKEAPLEHELKAHRSMLRAYQWHMMSGRRQGEALRELMDPEHSKLPMLDTLVTFDWREKLKLPHAPEETGAMWHCQQKVSLSCWGGAVVRHHSSSTPAAPRLQTTIIFYVTEVIEQSAESSNIMLREALREASVPVTGNLHLWSDTGPHFRSAENLYFYARVLPKERNQNVFIRWLGEQHGKGVLDQQFGLAGTHKHGWIGQFAREGPIYSIDDMCKALQQGADRQMKKYPDGPRYIVRKIEYPTNKATLRHFLYADSLKISRTYALEAEPYQGQARVQPALWNRVFAAFFEGAAEWLQAPPDPHKDHHLKRVFEQQKGVPPPRALLPEPTFDEKLQKQDRRRERARKRLHARVEHLRKLRDGVETAGSAESASGSSTSSSDSSSDSSGE
ncbi:unnamed protein product, partial [Symbiodinium sp. CCMP2456]